MCKTGKTLPDMEAGQTCYRSLPCEPEHATGTGHTLQTSCRCFRDYGHATAAGQTLLTFYRSLSDTVDTLKDILQELTRQVQTCYKRLSNTTHILQKLIRYQGQATGDGQKPKILCMSLSDTVNMLHEIVKQCRHARKSYQILQTRYKRWSDTANILQKLVKHCRNTRGDVRHCALAIVACHVPTDTTLKVGHITGAFQTLRICYSSWSNATKIKQEIVRDYKLHELISTCRITY